MCKLVPLRAEGTRMRTFAGVDEGVLLQEELVRESLVAVRLGACERLVG